MNFLKTFTEKYELIRWTHDFLEEFIEKENGMRITRMEAEIPQKKSEDPLLDSFGVVISFLEPKFVAKIPDKTNIELVLLCAQIIPHELIKEIEEEVETVKSNSIPLTLPEQWEWVYKLLTNKTTGI